MTVESHALAAPELEPASDRLISERQVLAYRPALAANHLVAARKAGSITWTKGKRGTAWYRLADVDAFLKTRERPRIAPAVSPPSPPKLNGNSASAIPRDIVEDLARTSAERILGPDHPV